MNRYKKHAWHGIDPGPNLPSEVAAFIETVPMDIVKYDVDKVNVETAKYKIDKINGYFSMDGAQKFPHVVPSPHGFIPHTYCGDKVADYDAVKSGGRIGNGDGDALDICVLCERTIFHEDILLRAIPIGGIRMLHKGEVDDKIISVLKGDEVYAFWSDIDDVPETMINNLKHYFLNYKNIPETGSKVTEVMGVFGKEEAHELIKRSISDYKIKFGK